MSKLSNFGKKLGGLALEVLVLALEVLVLWAVLIVLVAGVGYCIFAPLGYLGQHVLHIAKAPHTMFGTYIDTGLGMIAIVALVGCIIAVIVSWVKSIKKLWDESADHLL